MIAAAIKVEAVVQVLAPNVAALDAYKAAIESKVERALPAPSRTRTDKATGRYVPSNRQLWEAVA